MIDMGASSKMGCMKARVRSGMSMTKLPMKASGRIGKGMARASLLTNMATFYTKVSSCMDYKAMN